MLELNTIFLVVLLALIFDFINGFHDTANAVATSVYTRALPPGLAVAIAAIFNFTGALSGTAVALVIGKSIVNPDIVTPLIIIAALIGAMLWNIFTWYLGLPSSSSHALIGGLSGAVIAGCGIDAVMWSGFWRIFAGLILSPVLGLVAGSIVMTVLYCLFGTAAPARVNAGFRKLQIISACMASFSHGSNDAQKSMGIITMVLVGGGLLSTFEVPLWVKFACAASMAAGTAIGGWRIIRTMGGRIFRIEPINGFAADFTSSVVIYSATMIGAPVSTTHVVSSAIMGVGAAKRFKGVRWNIAGQILMTWFITIPSVAIIALSAYNILKVLIS